MNLNNLSNLSNLDNLNTLNTQHNPINSTNLINLNNLYINNEIKEINILKTLDNKTKVGFEFEFKIAIFDLDQTLWNGENLYKDSLNILKTLYRHDIKIYLVSFNLEADKICKLLNIEKYFEEIYFTREKTKLQIIKEILLDYPDIEEKAVVFFDDLAHNLYEVNINSNIQTIKIDNDGIDWTYIPIKYVYRFYHYLYE